MSIHDEHPFRPADDALNPVRRLRGRLASPVALLTAGQGRERAGLTVSSVLVADGDPGLVIAIVDPLSDLHDALLETGTAVLNVLGSRHRQLADAFGYVAPAPGGPFTLAGWSESEWGPVLTGAPAWSGCRLAVPPEPAGWGVEIRLAIEAAHLDSDEPPLVHRRGRYAQLAE